MNASNVRVRSATPADLPFVLGLVPRLTEFGAPAWRPAAAIESDSAASLRQAVEEAGDDGAVLVAEDASGERVGIVHVEVEADFVTGEERAFVGDLIVAAEAEGRGVARSLMAAAEAWARERGLRSLTLYVFAGNRRARELYARQGFLEDGLRLVRPLDAPADGGNEDGPAGAGNEDGPAEDAAGPDDVQAGREKRSTCP